MTASPTPTPTFCPNCQRRIAAGEARCRGCGTRVPGVHVSSSSITTGELRAWSPYEAPPGVRRPPVPPPPRGRRRRARLLVGLGAVAALLGAVAAVWLFVRDDGSDTAAETTVATGAEATAPEESAVPQATVAAAAPDATDAAAEPTVSEPPAESTAATGATAYETAARGPLGRLATALRRTHAAVDATRPTTAALARVRTVATAQLAVSERARADAAAIRPAPEGHRALVRAAAAQRAYLGLVAQAATAEAGQAGRLLARADVQATTAIRQYGAYFDEVGVAEEDALLDRALFDTSPLRAAVNERARLNRPAGAALVRLRSSTCTVDVPSGWDVVAIDQDRSGIYSHSEARSPDGAAAVICDVDRTPTDAATIARRVYAFRGRTSGYREISFTSDVVAGREARVWRFVKTRAGEPTMATDVFFDGGVALLVQVQLDRRDDYDAILARVLESYGGSIHG